MIKVPTTSFGRSLNSLSDFSVRMFFLIVSLDISLLCFLPLPLATLCPALNNSFSLLALICIPYAYQKRGGSDTKRTCKHVFSQVCGEKKKIALEVLPCCSNCEEKEGDICCCVGSAQPTVMSTQSVQGTSGTSQSSLIDDWTLQRVHLHPVPLHRTLMTG